MPQSFLNAQFQQNNLGSCLSLTGKYDWNTSEIFMNISSSSMKSWIKTNTIIKEIKLAT